MPISFPLNPTLNQVYTYNGLTWRWDGEGWEPGVAIGATGATGPQGIQGPIGATGSGATGATGLIGATGLSANLTAVNSNIVPAANVTYDLGTASLRWRDLYLSGNSINLGGAVITAANNAVVLPAGSVIGTSVIGSGGATVTVSNTVPATTSQGSLWFDADTGDLSVYASGGWAGVGTGPIGATGPAGAPGSSVSVVRITALDVTDNSYTVLDDTAVDTTGGYIRITGANFASGCMVYVGLTPAASTTFISSTEIRAQLSATAAGTYPVYVVNTDGSTAIRVPGVTFSANPAWQTASALPDQYDGVAITLNLVATDATSYTVTSGSLPPGLSLNANTGVISGTVTGVANDTVYTFTVRATDAQLQDSPRTFTVTITVSDPYFKLTTLLLSGSALSANTVVKDSSANNFNLTVFGDARASNFTPYGTGWSTYFSSTSGLTISGLTPIGSGDLTIETFVYMTTLSGEQHMVQQGTSTTNLLLAYDGAAQRLRFLVRNDAGSSNLDINSPSAPVLNQWFHFAGTVQGTTGRLWINGNVVTTGTVSGTRSGSQTFVYMGDNGSGGSRPLTGYLSNTRIVVGTAVYTANFSPTTTNLSSVSGTSLLTNQSNRFINLVGNVAATISQGSPNITSFNPFNITNTGADGSMYFDGTGDYCTTSGNAAFALGTGDFCLETWIYPNSISTGTFDRIVATSDYNGTGFDWTLNTASSALYVAGTAYSISNLVVRSWNHLVYTRSGGVLRGFLNGNLAVYNASATGNVTSTGELRIGTGYSGTAYNGYISNLRIVKGSVPIAYQTGSTTINATVFSPPTTLLTAVTGTSLLTLQYDQPHNNHTFLDSSSNQFLITRNGNATQGTFSPFSQAGWSVLFTRSNNTDRVLVSSNAGLGLQSNNFTVELWAYFNSAYTGDGPFCVNIPSGGFAANTWWFGPHSVNSGRVTVYIYNFSSSGPFIAESTSPPVNQWVHYALVRSSNTFTIYRNGVSTATGTFSGAVGSSTSLLYIGRSGDAGATASGFDGYISNLRIVNGVAVYTGTFTPPTVQLTITQSIGANIAAITGTQTGLLCLQSNRLLDNSTFAASLSMDAGSPKIQAFSPFAPTAVYNPATHGGSAYFDGTGDYLALPTSNATLYPGPGAFTFECWIYPTGTLATLQSVFSYGGSAGNLRVFIQNGGLQIWNGATSFTAGNTALVKNNAWNHIVVQRDSSNYLTSYVNGTRDYYTVQTVDYNAGSLQIAADGGANLLTGYESVFSFIKGSATYSGATITVPIAPLTATTNTQLLFNFTDAAIVDSTGRNVIETVADAKSSSVVTKFTGGAMYFDGTGDYVDIAPTASADLGGGDWTYEVWVYASSLPASQASIIALANVTGTGYAALRLRLNSSGNLELYISTNGTTWAVSGTSSAGIGATQWSHIAVVRNGSGSNNTQLYINGVTRLTLSLSGTPYSGGKYVIGCVFSSGSAGEFWNGYMQDLRITRGYARYTANFTAPTAPARLK